MSGTQDQKDYQDYSDYHDYLKAQGGEAAPEEAPGALTNVVRGLDYQRANTTGPLIAAALSKLTGKNAAPGADLSKVRHLNGDFPGTGEMLKNVGFLPDDKPVFGDTVAGILRSDPYTAPLALLQNHPTLTRGAIGFAGDIASDPATYESMGISALAKLKNLGKLAPLVRGANMIANPLEEFFKWRQGANYGKAFQKIGEESKDMGKSILPAQILQDQGFVGNSRAAAQAIRTTNKGASKEIGDVLTEASAKGAGVDPWAMLHDAMAKAQELKAMGVKEATKLGQDIEERALDLWRTHGQTIPVDKATELKTFLDEQVKQAGHLAGGEASIAKQGQAASANQLRNEIPKAVEAVDPALSERLLGANKTFAATDKNVYKKMRAFAKTAPELAGPLGYLKSDLAVMGAGGAGGYASGMNPYESALAALALKHGGGALMSTTGRTLRGKVAGQIATHLGGMIDPMVRQGPRSVWEAMQGGE